MLSFAPSRRACAFTLVELLAVILIVGLLIAITLPTLGYIRQKAQAAQCASNLRQCWTGIQLYAADHRGFAPNTTWALQLQPYMSPNTNGKKEGVFPTSCPSKPYDNSEYGRSTYTFNKWLDTDGDNKNSDGTYSWIIPLRNIDAPSRKIMLFDAVLVNESGGVDSAWSYGYNKGVEFVEFRHPSATANILFVDGHVASLHREDINSQMW